MIENDYDGIYWKKIEKFSFFYPLSQIWNTSPMIRKIVLVLWMLSILVAAFIVYMLVSNKLINENRPIIFIFTIAVVIVLLFITVIIYILLDKCKFNAWIYDKWIEIDLKTGRLYSELNKVKIYQYHENWNDYIKLIYTEYDGRITTENLLYNPKMDDFLDKFQESFQKHWISCERISDIKKIDISDEVEYKTRFWFFKVWRLLSRKEKIHRIKNVMIFILLYLFFWGIMFISSLFWDEDTSFSEAIQQLPDNFYSWLKVFSIILVILIIFLTIQFILSIKKFYARIENNAVYILNWYWWKWINSSDNYILSKIKANYWIVTEWNLEWIMLNIDDGDKTKIYKRPKNEEVEHFCNDLLAEIRKRKTA